MSARDPGPSVAAHVFVDDLDSLDLHPDDDHHLRAVLRLRAGEAVTASDGRGRWRPCTVSAGGALLEPAGEVVGDPAPSPALTVGIALTKGDRPEWAVQKLTECGVDRIVPVASARAVVRWDAAKAARNRDRLARIAREAAMQSRRTWLPEILPLTAFADAAAALGPGLALAERGGRPLSLATPAVLVGPEGGWADDELAAGLPTVDLGPHVLRSETASVAAGVLLGSLRAGLVVANDHS
ncbi:MAG TPA: RsmE family RNA methyltransferase [Acidimicrobiales bacterium]|nr:RsmE family RNA methyltransferase [Acidimicrobiales bacterium]